MKTTTLLLTAMVGLALPSHAEVRVWKNTEGKEISAEMTGLQGDKVLLKLPNGKVLPYPLAQLSAADQAFAKSQPASAPSAAALTKGMNQGKLELQSATQLTFGPGGVLFIGDSRAAAIIALATGDTSPGSAREVKVEGIDQKLAALLGTSVDQVQIQDVVVNPISKNIYLSVLRGKGPQAATVLAKVDGKGDIAPVPLDNALFSRAELADAPTDGRQRQESITDIAYFQDQVLVAGLSNEEFASSFRAIPFPFQKVEKGAGIEIYHGAHGKFETRSPVRTFLPFSIGGQPSLLAAYTCTPLVQIPIKDLSPGAKVRGKTIAELGNRNRPLDMILYEKDGKQFVLMANSARGIMKISTENLEHAADITEKTGIAGQPYETIKALEGVDQLDAFDTAQALTLRRVGSGLNLETVGLP
ncbi:MAG: hypothetical protein LDL31_10595 [Prosthecobacter sp.]|nr:hypothetical protein [Prosthecobacter sp.]